MCFLFLLQEVRERDPEWKQLQVLKDVCYTCTVGLMGSKYTSCLKPELGGSCQCLSDDVPITIDKTELV